MASAHLRPAPERFAHDLTGRPTRVKPQPPAPGRFQSAPGPKGRTNASRLPRAVRSPISFPAPHPVKRRRLRPPRGGFFRWLCAAAKVAPFHVRAFLLYAPRFPQRGSFRPHFASARPALNTSAGIFVAFRCLRRRLLCAWPPHRLRARRPCGQTKKLSPFV